MKHTRRDALKAIFLGAASTQGTIEPVQGAAREESGPQEKRRHLIDGQRGTASGKGIEGQRRADLGNGTFSTPLSRATIQTPPS